MDGIRNSRIHYTGQCSPQFRLRWTDLFFVECHLNSTDSPDPTRLADLLAKAFTQALTPVFEMLVEAKCRKLALRVTIDRENVSARRERLASERVLLLFARLRIWPVPMANSYPRSF